MKILLRFFKSTGKWYTDITVPTKSDDWNIAMDQIEAYLKDNILSTDMYVIAIPQRRDNLQITEGVPKLFNYLLPKPDATPGTTYNDIIKAAIKVRDNVKKSAVTGIMDYGDLIKALDKAKL